MAANRSNTRGGINRARQIANQGTSPLQQAAANTGRTTSTSAPQQAANTTGATSTAVSPPIQQANGYPRMELGVLVSSPHTTGLAGSINAATRTANEGKEPAVVYVNRLTKDGDNMNDSPISRPNPLYKVPNPPPKPNPESPKTESIIATEVDKIIEESREIVKEIEIKKDPARPPVEPFQDIVRPPVAITPTELILEAQANCEKDIQSPSINIVNNFNPVIDLSATAAVSSSAAPILTIAAALQGCTDPDALNYDPAAKIDDASCLYEPVGEEEPVTVDNPVEPVALLIPDTVTFVDSHGGPLFEVLKTEVIKTEQITKFGGVEGGGFAILPDGTKLQASIQLMSDITRPALEDSDLVLSLEDNDVADRKNIRADLGELASDTKLASDEEIVIIGDKEKLKKSIVRSNNGIIFLNLEHKSSLNISLRSQAFNFNQYKRTIDTTFTELLGKR
jgi:hypothetical protein